jgi:hypothetical protein
MKSAKQTTQERQFMWQVSISLARLCLFAVLAGCSVDRSNLGALPHKDAAMSPDTVFPIGLDASTDALASGGRGGAGGSGGAETGNSTGGSGGAPADGANLAADTAGAGGVKGDVDRALDSAGEVAEDSAPTTRDTSGTDRTADSIENGGDAADGAAAAPEVGAADVPDLRTDTYETGGKDEGDAGCLNNDCLPFIVPSFPAAMKCNLDGSTAELSWSDLSTWNPTYDSRLCDSAGAYYIQGNVVGFQPGLQVLAEVYAPEDSKWYPISGGPIVQPDAAGGFNGSFCLPQKGLDRTFRFRIVQPNTSQDAGVACLIHVRP